MKRILKRMGQLNDIRKITNFVKTEIKWHDVEDKSSDAIYNGHAISRTAAIERYAQNNRIHDRSKVRKMFDYALDKGYLKFDEVASQKNLWILENNDKGYRITRAFLKMPTGLIEEYFNEHKTAINIISASIIGAASVIVAVIVKGN